MEGNVGVQGCGSLVACFLLQEGVEEPMIIHSWRCGWTRLAAISIRTFYLRTEPLSPSIGEFTYSSR